MYLQIVFILLLCEGNGPLKTGLVHVRIYRCVYATRIFVSVYFPGLLVLQVERIHVTNPAN